MKVQIRLIDLETVVPELISAIRSLSDDLPSTVELDALPTVEEEKERALRSEFIQYWEGLTMMEWRLFVHFFVHRDCSRKELKVIMYGDYVSVDEEHGYQVSNVVDVHVKNLRNRLRFFGNKHHILTKRGWGYLFRDGEDPEERHSYYQPSKKKARKELTASGALKEKSWRKRKNILNAVEFGYLKEMKMDEISKEEIGKFFDLEGKALDWAWEASSYDRYNRATFLQNLK